MLCSVDRRCWLVGAAESSNLRKQLQPAMSRVRDLKRMRKVHICRVSQWYNLQLFVCVWMGQKKHHHRGHQLHFPITTQVHKENLENAQRSSSSMFDLYQPAKKLWMKKNGFNSTRARGFLFNKGNSYKSPVNVLVAPMSLAVQRRTFIRKTVEFDSFQIPFPFYWARTGVNPIY